MKNYKDYETINIGNSDIASLVLVGFKNNIGAITDLLKFNEDGAYSAYLVDSEAKIKSHYTKVATFNTWLKIYDDFGLVQYLTGQEINIYRAGAFGCIIQILC